MSSLYFFKKKISLKINKIMIKICNISAKRIGKDKRLWLSKIRLNPNNHYYHGFHNTFDNKHFTNSD